MKKFYKVLGKGNDGYYNLGYTSNKKVCEKYYISNGWKKKDLIFIKRK